MLCLIVEKYKEVILYHRSSERLPYSATLPTPIDLTTGHFTVHRKDILTFRLEFVYFTTVSIVFSKKKLKVRFDVDYFDHSVITFSNLSDERSKA